MSVLTVGFDLDMTLVDSRPGIAATYRVLSQRTGVAIDTDLVVSRLGPPLVHEMAHWFPAEQVAEAVEEYRALYSDHAIAPTVPLPGAVDALAAVRAAGGRVVVVTSKLGRLARLHLEHHGFVVDAVAGDRWADGKTAALREHGVDVYVGDHVADMASARDLCAAVGVTTGPCSAAELTGAGADVVLSDLTGFPNWFAGYLLDTRLADLDGRLRSIGRVVVAFSGGADSAFLLAAAVRALGPGSVTAATAVSASLPARELVAAPRAWGLSTWDKPAAACLSSRIAYGIAITPDRLARVDRAEVRLRAALAAAGLQVRDLRVRDLGDAARVELDADLVGQVSARPDLLDAVRGAGFEAVEVDPRGFRSGAMNELLAQPERYR